ncbi:hypothetical protein M5X00_24160 [Paenibacillus alvei]|uniref:Uncharacterized protein n=1 Tax=Paenibacillus alvei TaxID=44250 RepID=A0ABT4GR39_PAEAL|nr:hypothetical protein [Paenibacillus alvei]MCY9757324.1 hypothetical protein [Paenibacillus alvei]MCY9759145.1 hypothetical protein [Paenibacillus alvei]MCY9770396.1 hypothetical protein [Paenibacillus alvei]
MDNMTIETLGQLVGAIGFPSLVAILLLKYLLGNFIKRLDMLDKRLVQLNKTMVMVVKVLNQLTKESKEDLLMHLDPPVPPVVNKPEKD